MIYDLYIYLIKSLNDTKAVGYDEIRTYGKKRVALHLCGPLAEIINRSYCEQGVFPSNLKIFILKPLFEKTQ